MSAYLIAQLGKNYADGRNREIAGKELIELAWMIIEKTQYMFGGMVTFLEAEKEEKLLSFYRDNSFSQFDTRQTASGTTEPHELVQLLRLLLYNLIATKRCMERVSIAMHLFYFRNTVL